MLFYDDTILNNHRSECIEMVNPQYPGNDLDIIDGIGLVNTIWCDPENKDYIPIYFRVYDKRSYSKIKNNHFQQILKLALSRALQICIVVFDSRYSSLNNLKSIRDARKIGVTSLRKNRWVNKKETLEHLNIPDGKKSCSYVAMVRSPYTSLRPKTGALIISVPIWSPHPEKLLRRSLKHVGQWKLITGI